MGKDYTNIKTMKQLELQIRQLENDAVNVKTSFGRILNMPPIFTDPED